MASFESLPPELLLDIFEMLDYWDLRLRLRLVCKSFSILLSGGTAGRRLDRILFRDGTEGGSTETGKAKDSTIRYATYTVHPALHEKIYFFPPIPGRHRIIFRTRGTDNQVKYIPVVDTPVKEENATSPATNLIIVHTPKHIHKKDFFPSYPVIVSSASSVKTHEVLEVCLRLFDKYMAPPVAQTSYRTRGHAFIEPILEIRKRGVVHLYMQ